MPSPDNVVLIGAGLSGTLLAIALRRRGFNVEVFEARDDLRKLEIGVHRSINLVLTSRGRYALRKLGLEEEVMKLVVPAVGRCIHHQDGTVVIQPYGKDDNEANYSVSRSGLNCFLLDVAEKENVKIHFNHRFVKADVPKRTYVFADKDGKETTRHTFMCFGSDGAGSPVRRALLQHLLEVPPQDLPMDMRKHWEWGGANAIKLQIDRLGVSYKELMFPLKQDGSAPLDTRYLHIWPRGEHFLMGLANLDGSMTGTLYLPDDAAPAKPEGEEQITFDSMKDSAAGMLYLQKYYPDAVPLLPDAVKEWEENPHAFLATTRLSHWVWQDKLCLLGDACHAITPFFGQGMNCAFEDVSYVTYVMDKFHIKPGLSEKSAASLWTSALKAYQALRIPAGHAIADLAVENYHEMASQVGQPAFLLRAMLRTMVEREIPTLFRSRYWMVTNTQIPYHWAQELGTHVGQVVTELAKSTSYVDGKPVPDLQHARKLIAEHVTPYIEQRGIDLTNPWKFYGEKEFDMLKLTQPKL
eukprot:TRINITY_DN15034_c0_g1_i1.p1 TRINITY_DN15034_c0_g1~~TRINITY_DN15034_c0_g1_i1.p1  ORF type:complete len:525 (+),score=255.51 TRINITY_DN15034_c0_g1_i1:57-1631(+)